MYRLNSLNADIQLIVDGAWENRFSLDLFIYNYTVQASSPELAFMECLLLVLNRYSFMDLYYIMEQLTALRPAKVQQLLETTNNMTVKRMFLYMAEKANYPWYKAIDVSRINLGTSKIQLCKGGVYVSKYKITIPRELAEYE